MKCICYRSLFIALLSFASISNSNLISLKWENDVLFKTDYYYSQGVSIGLETKSFALVGICKKIFPETLDTFNYSGKVCFNNAIYTPKNIRESIPDKNDAPYAGLTWVSFSQAGFSDKYIGSLEIELGVLGSASFSDEFQKFIHRATDNPMPQGWEYQLSNGPIINLRLSASRIKWIANNHLYGILGTDLCLGTINTDLGLRIRIGGGIGLDAFGFSGNEIISRGYRKYQVNGYAEYDPKVVLWDGTLSGMPWSDNVEYAMTNREISRIRGRFRTGIECSLNRFGLDFYIEQRTRTFINGDSHLFSGFQIIIK